MQTKIKGLSLWCAVFSSTTALTLAALPGTVAAEDTRINGFYENATYARDGVGLSKFRNTIQLEGEKRIGNVGIFSNVSVNGTLDSAPGHCPGLGSSRRRYCAHTALRFRHQ